MLFSTLRILHGRCANRTSAMCFLVIDIAVDLYVRSSPLFSAGKAAGAAIVFPARCHYWQRPLPISSASAANKKGEAFSPLRCGLVPICRRLFPLIPADVGKREAFRAAWLFFVRTNRSTAISLPYLIPIIGRLQNLKVVTVQKNLLMADLSHFPI